MLCFFQKSSNFCFKFLHCCCCCCCCCWPNFFILESLGVCFFIRFFSVGCCSFSFWWVPSLRLLRFAFHAGHTRRNDSPATGRHFNRLPVAFLFPSFSTKNIILISSSSSSSSTRTTTTTILLLTIIIIILNIIFVFYPKHSIPILLYYIRELFTVNQWVVLHR